jgi:hypothetical protein
MQTFFSSRLCQEDKIVSIHHWQDKYVTNQSLQDQDNVVILMAGRQQAVVFLPVGIRFWQLHDIQIAGLAFFDHFRCVIVLALLIDPPFVGDFFAVLVAALVAQE